MTGYSTEELAKMPFINIVHPDYRDMVLDRHRQRLSGEDPPSTYSYRIINRADEERWVELSTVLIQWEGRPATLNFVRDITEQKHLEAQLQHAQKMESIGTMSGGVAHNFRNILAGISANSQLLEMQHQDSPPVLSLTERINNAVKKGAQLVDGLMEFSRKRVAQKYEVLNAVQLIQESYDLIRKSFDKKIDIQIQHPEILPVMGDHSGLSQVIMNLCINARDTMPDGGQLRIEAKQKLDELEITISDTGQGMDNEILEKCFDPFFTTKELGTGLGLSTSYGIVNEHGGDIQVNSVVGEGTTFKIRLPVATAIGNRGEGKNADIVKGAGQKILVVDDEIEILEGIAALVESIGYKTASATSGAKAVKKYLSWHADAVLIDRNMPRMDGITCAKEIKEQDPAARIILISGYNETGPYGIDQQTRDLISGYLTKPIELYELSRVLTQLFGSPRSDQAA
jgi:PAS domain S-box-containing protein